MPNKKYNIILCDVPWSYRDKCHAGSRGVEYKYPTLSLEEVKQLGVSVIAAPDCALFFWATMPMLSEALQVIAAWGFTYKTAAFTWIKTNKKSGTLFWGMGNFTRANPELCLLAMRGRLVRQSASVHSVIESPIAAHSQKPDIVRDRIVQLFGDLPRIEVFARKKVNGWDSCGNAIDGQNIKDLLPPLSQPQQLELLGNIPCQHESHLTPF